LLEREWKNYWYSFSIILRNRNVSGDWYETLITNMYSKGSTRKYATVEDSLISATMNLDIPKNNVIRRLTNI
jgi:hypothetical protein